MNAQIKNKFSSFRSLWPVLCREILYKWFSWIWWNIDSRKMRYWCQEKKFEIKMCSFRRTKNKKYTKRARGDLGQQTWFQYEKTGLTAELDWGNVWSLKWKHLNINFDERCSHSSVTSPMTRKERFGYFCFQANQTFMSKIHVNSLVLLCKDS